MISISSHPAHKPLVTRLSPDILFIIARLAYPDIGDGSAKSFPVDPYVQNDSHFKDSFADLAKVCSHWRLAFLSCPSFWTKLQIPERSVWYLEEKLRRSAEYPLKITVHYHQQFSSRMLAQQFNILFTYLHRIQSLIIHQTHGYHKPIPSYVLSLITNPAPMLEVFHYDSATAIDFKRLISGTERSLPESLFANHAPNLTELRIATIKLSRNNLPNFKTIRRLSLVFVHGLTQYGLLNILEAVSCNLEALEIATPSHFPWPFDLCEDHRPAISVSSLQTLRLSVGIAVLLVVVSHTTDIPLDIKWDINCTDLIAEIDIDITPFLLFLARIRKGNYIIFSIYDEIHLKFGQTPSGPYNTLRFFMGTLDTEKHVMRLNTIFSAMSLSNVNSCELTCPGRLLPFWMEEYERMFQSLLFIFNQIEKLSISCDNMAFVWYLRPRTTDTMRTILPSPLLRDLKVGLVTSMDEASGLIQDLIARKEAGNILTNLSVDYENHLEEYPIRRDLAKLVQNVTMTAKPLRT